MTSHSLITNTEPSLHNPPAPAILHPTLTAATSARDDPDSGVLDVK